MAHAGQRGRDRSKDVQKRGPVVAIRLAGGRADAQSARSDAGRDRKDSRHPRDNSGWSLDRRGLPADIPESQQWSLAGHQKRSVTPVARVTEYPDRGASAGTQGESQPEVP